MYPNKTFNLVYQIKTISEQPQHLNQWVNEVTFRSQLLTQSPYTGKPSSNQSFIDPMQLNRTPSKQEFYINKVTSKMSLIETKTQKWHMLTFAFCCMLVVGGSVFAVEKITYNRQQATLNQAD